MTFEWTKTDMPLRDWFAGMALASISAAPPYRKGPPDDEVADRAYLIADEMMKRREKDADDA